MPNVFDRIKRIFQNLKRDVKAHTQHYESFIFIGYVQSTIGAGKISIIFYIQFSEKNKNVILICQI
jgi:hypothetical protein